MLRAADGDQVSMAVAHRPRYVVAVMVCVERVQLLWVQRVVAAVTDASPRRSTRL